MRNLPLLFVLAALPATLAAQLQPQPSESAPQIQTVQFTQGSSVLLTMLPDTPITVMLEPGQSVAGVTPGEGDDFKIRVSADRNSFMVLPTPGAIAGKLDIATQTRNYSFSLRVEPSYAAALVVRFVDENRLDAEVASIADQAPAPLGTWHYRLRGDRAVRPADLSDDGYKTRITYAPGQALPAVFAIGPTGEEEVVNGYMRGDVFVIDRVYSELVFRIDKEKATAQRDAAPEEVL